MEGKQFLYKRLYDSLNTKIIEGVYKPGEKLPADEELMKTYGVSAITTKKALTMLAENGIINRIPSRGSFVSVPEKKVVPVSDCKVIGVILEHVSTPFGLDMLYGMDTAAQEQGYKIFVRFTYGDRKRENEEIEFLMEQGVAGLIVMPTHGFHFNTKLIRLILDGYPIVLIDKELKGIPVPTIISDNRYGMDCLVSHLVERGNRRIALITNGDMETSSVTDRVGGFYDACRRLDIEPSPQCSLRNGAEFIETKPNAGKVQQINRYLRENRYDLDAVVCAEYSFIPDTLAVCNRLGIRIPEDLKVCCIDEDYLAPSGYFFTHAKQNEGEIARRAVDCLLNALSGNPPADEPLRIKPVLKIGKSTGEPTAVQGSIF